MKKTIVILLAVILLLGALSGCGGGKSWTGTHYVDVVVANYGTFTLEINCNAAPLTAGNFLSLVDKGFYNGLTFYRVINGFAAYGGDPNGNGTGTSGTTITGEFLNNGVNNPLSNTRGAIGMARGIDMDSASCQFYIMQQSATYLDGAFAVFGYVYSGMEVVDAICSGTPVTGADGYIATGSQPVITSMKVTS